MTQSSKILNLFKQSGILYDSNQFSLIIEYKTYKCWTGLTRIHLTGKMIFIHLRKKLMSNSN